MRAGERLDWRRLIDRLAEHIEMLEIHLLLFQYLYPGRRDVLPGWVRDEVSARARAARAIEHPEDAFRGLALDPVAFAVDIERWGFFDARRQGDR
jgi:hypothetical protein